METQQAANLAEASAAAEGGKSSKVHCVIFGSSLKQSIAQKRLRNKGLLSTDADVDSHSATLLRDVHLAAFPVFGSFRLRQESKLIC